MTYKKHLNSLIASLKWRTIPMGSLAVILAAIVSATTIHELGHALACLFLGLSIERFAVWPLSLTRKGDSWKLAIWQKSWVAGASGFVQFRPVWSKGLRVRLVAILLAGPSASALAACVCFSVREHFVKGSDLSNFFNVLALTALLQIANIIPFKGRKGVASDGRRIWELIRVWRKLGGYEALQSFAPQLTKRRPRDWDHDLLQQAVQNPCQGTQWYKNWLNYKWCADTGRIADARAALDWAMAHKEAGVAGATPWEYVWFEAFAAHDLAAAQQRLSVAQTSLPAHANPLYKWRALAAVATLEGRADDAASAAAAALDCLKRTADPTSVLAAAFKSDLAEMLARLPASPNKIARA